MDYREVGDWSHGGAVGKAIVVRPQDCTREQLVNLANHLSRRFVLNPVVVINIFNDEAAALNYDRQKRDDEQNESTFAHWPARYLKSRSAGLNQLVIYPHCDHHNQERVDY
ncbi:MAG: hypothetical protein ACYCYF_10620 [Anaerolineae bacterium]